MPPKRKAEDGHEDDGTSAKKRKLTHDREIRLPIEVIGDILGHFDFEEATILSRVAIDWRSAYKVDVLKRFKRQYIKRLKFVHSTPKFKSQEQVERDLRDVTVAIENTRKEIESMEQYCAELMDLKLQNSSLSISEQFFLWSTAPVQREDHIWKVNLEPEGEPEIWRLTTWEPVKHRTYTLEDMTERLMEHFNVVLDDKGRASGDPENIAVCEKYFKELMDANFGSCVYDW
jgi:hypothetical protein